MMGLFTANNRVFQALRLVGGCFFLAASLCPVPARAIELFPMPQPGVMVDLSSACKPALLRGVLVNTANPLLIDFILDPGDERLSGDAEASDSRRMIKYFLTALTIPEDEQWVNLSPYEGGRLVSSSLGDTEMGRDLLAMDYFLKQIMASLIYPEKGLGQAFWARVYRLAYDKYGTTDIPLDMFNKVWIMPKRAVIFEKGAQAFIVEASMGVMLDSDYAASSQLPEIMAGRGAMPDKEAAVFSQKAMNEIVIPALEREVNAGESFAGLRKIFYAMVLSAWYKRKIREGLLAGKFVDRNKTLGDRLNDATAIESIYQQYLGAFRKGVFDYVKEDVDIYTRELLPRKYFSGGLDASQKAWDAAVTITRDAAGVAAAGELRRINGELLVSQKSGSVDNTEVLFDGKFLSPEERQVQMGAARVDAEPTRNGRTRLTLKTIDGHLLGYLLVITHLATEESPAPLELIGLLKNEKNRRVGKITVEMAPGYEGMGGASRLFNAVFDRALLSQTAYLYDHLAWDNKRWFIEGLGGDYEGVLLDEVYRRSALNLPTSKLWQRYGYVLERVIVEGSGEAMDVHLVWRPVDAELKVDSAEALSGAQPTDVGGIDLSDRALEMVVNDDGQAVHFQMDPARWAALPLNGLFPRILAIVPLTDLPALFAAHPS
jgi:hypothetical protein